MNKFFKIVVAFAMAATLAACSNVEVGYGGVKVDKYGDDRGVSQEVLSPGRYFTGFNTTVYEYPTFTKTDKWTKSANEGKAIDESITFQISGGVSVNTDVGISYHVDKADITKVFQKYRTDIETVSDGPLRNIVRDELARAGIKYDIEALQGKGKTELMDEVMKDVQARAKVIGITVESISFISEIRAPQAIQNSLNAKIQATQDAMRIENEVRQTKAQQEKLIVQADAQVKVAEAEAKAMELRGKAMQANSNLLELKRLEVQQEAIHKWDGALPAQMIPGSAVPFLNLK